MELRHQLVRPPELLRFAQSSHKSHFQFPPVYIAGKIQNMGFQSKRVLLGTAGPESGITAETGHGGHSFAPVGQPGRGSVNGGPRQHDPGLFQVGCGHAEQRTAPTGPVHHHAAHRMRSSQHGVGQVQASVGQSPADTGGTDGRALEHDGVDVHHLEPQTAAYVRDGLGTGLIPAQTEIIPDKQNMRMQSLLEDRTAELLGGHGRQFQGERHKQSGVHSQGGQQIQPLPGAAQSGGRIVGQHPRRMRLEGNGQRSQAQFMCTVHGAPDQGLVPQMHAVEIADGDHKRPGPPRRTGAFLRRGRNDHGSIPRNIKKAAVSRGRPPAFIVSTPVPRRR